MRHSDLCVQLPSHRHRLELAVEFAYWGICISRLMNGAMLKKRHVAPDFRGLVPEHYAKVKFVSHALQAFVTRPDGDARLQTRRG